MKRFGLLILIIYLVIDDDNEIHAEVTEDYEDFIMDKTTEIRDMLEDILKTGVREVDIDNDIGTIFETREGNFVFVKDQKKDGYDKKYQGEVESLKAIRDTNTIKVPRPITTDYAKVNKRHLIVLHYNNMTEINNKASTDLGNQLADLHLYNLQHKNSKKPPIKKFGFHVETSTGYIPENNTWTDDWITFFIENRMNHQIKILESKPNHSPRAKKIFQHYWPRLKPIIPKFFEGIEVKPSLLHGDFWPGNYKMDLDSKPVIYDPASFYGHHEFDIAESNMFGFVYPNFNKAYFKKIPKAKRFNERIVLYQLYIHLKQWNLYDGNYVSPIIDVFDRLLDFDFKA